MQGGDGVGKHKGMTHVQAACMLGLLGSASVGTSVRFQLGSRALCDVLEAPSLMDRILQERKKTPLLTPTCKSNLVFQPTR